MCLFCNFLTGKQTTSTEGYPFIPINKTKNTISFLSVDTPAHEEGHILIIPKKHYKNITDLPKPLQNELINHATLAAKILKRSHGGCNILLNEGKAAGQNINHVHFHVIPRDKNDKIKIEQWKRKKLSKENFETISNKLKKKFKGRD
jgi:histidine triad (HIT) family protein